MTPRTKEQNEEIRLRRLVEIRKAAADVFLSKGPLLEIRDVAVEAGLGYGTVYHYYSNKNDLLYDLLWDALERAGSWLESPHATTSEDASASGHFSLAAAGTRNAAAVDSRSEILESAAALELSSVATAGIRLLQLWAEDHALYLLHKLAGEGFASLPEARATVLSAAFRREMLAPLAALLETGESANGATVSDWPATELPFQLQHAEMLLAALVGCAALSLRRGKLHEEASDIVRLLKL